jgi:flavin reductase (DIM6/NTAB) family NADH-FMN oxidoreductase RutF
MAEIAATPVQDFRSQTVLPPVYYFGTPVVLVTTVNADGTPTVSPMSSAWALGDRIVLGMAGTSHGRTNLIRERQAVLNFPDGLLWQNVEAIARATGRNPVPPHKEKMGYQYVADKVGLCGLATVTSHKVRPPRLEACPLQIEVELLAVHDPANWPAALPETYQILETRVLVCHAHAAIL